MKIELFSKMVKEKALSEPKRKLEELNVKHAQILDDMESGCEDSRSEHLLGIQHKALERKSKVIAKTHSEAQNRILKKKSALFLALKDSLVEEVKIATHSEHYEAYFKEKLETALKNFDGSEELVIGVNPNDEKYLPEGTSVELSEGLLGGFYIIKGGSEKYDFTLDSEVNALDDYLGCMLNTLYETTGEACEDE
jgi:vacuolar-type H+-ATPase subunit E/Vma4